MKLIGQELGRVILLFGAEEIRPAQGIDLVSAIEALKARYGFVTVPNLSLPSQQLDRDGYKFESGTFQWQGQPARIGEFNIFSDGITVSSFDTAISDAVLTDVLNWGKSALGLREFARPPTKLFRSQLVVEFSKSLSKVFKDFSAISSIVSTALAANTECKNPVNVTRLDFGADPTAFPGSVKPLPLIIERRANYSYEHERYYSECSFPTHIHLQVLEQIEKLLS